MSQVSRALLKVSSCIFSADFSGEGRFVPNLRFYAETYGRQQQQSGQAGGGDRSRTPVCRRRQRRLRTSAHRGSFCPSSARRRRAPQRVHLLPSDAGSCSVFWGKLVGNVPVCGLVPLALEVLLPDLSWVWLCCIGGAFQLLGGFLFLWLRQENGCKYMETVLILWFILQGQLKTSGPMLIRKQH